MDFNVNNYTYSELLDIINATDDTDDITTKLDELVQLNSKRPDHVNFLEEIRAKIFEKKDDFNENKRKFISNPTFKDIIHRLILVDSQYRLPAESATSFCLELEEPLHDVLSLSLYSYAIPYTFYNIAEDYGNNKFIVNGSTEIVITSGRYTMPLLIEELCKYPPISASYSRLTGKITLTGVESIFFDNLKNSLGYIMGFRTPFLSSEDMVFTGEAVANVNLNTYFILDIDDYNQGHCSSTLFGTVNALYRSNIALPTYYNSQQPLISYPRTLTQAQIYTVQQILIHNKKPQNRNTQQPLPSSNTFAIIPFKHQDCIDTVNVEFGGTLQENKRVYLGPVTISKLKIRLYNDKNLLLNLNDSNWNFVLTAEILKKNDLV